MTLGSRLLSLPILIYRYGISPLMPARCRFQPTCSQYALEALAQHGALKGLGLAVRRILRCHPWGGYGYDPVPCEQVKSGAKNSEKHESGHCGCKVRDGIA
jgi:putative membrane protein insertion efficiency factor